MKTRRWRIVVLLLSAVVALGAMVPAALAFMAAQTPPIINTFTADGFSSAAQVPVQVVKTIAGGNLTPAGFAFALEDESGHVITLTTGEDGTASTVLRLSTPNSTLRYQLYEINDGRAGVCYSTAVYDIIIRTPVEDGYIAPEITVNGESVRQICAAFENAYVPTITPPLTGDSTPLLLYAALMLASAAALCALMRRRSM